MRITIATLDDVESIAPLFNQYRVFYDQEDDLKLAINFLYSRIKNNESIVFYAAENDNSIIGFTQLYPVFSSISASKSIILNDLYVVENKRKLGIATQLIEKTFEFCQKNNITSISLQTHKNNLEAQKIYRKLKFKLDDEFYVFHRNLNNFNYK